MIYRLKLLPDFYLNGTISNFNSIISKLARMKLFTKKSISVPTNLVLEVIISNENFQSY
jgi:hypothetical protein